MKSASLIRSKHLNKYSRSVLLNKQIHKETELVMISRLNKHTLSLHHLQLNNKPLLSLGENVCVYAQQFVRKSFLTPARKLCESLHVCVTKERSLCLENGRESGHRHCFAGILLPKSDDTGKLSVHKRHFSVWTSNSLWTSQSTVMGGKQSKARGRIIIN